MSVWVAAVLGLVIGIVAGFFQSLGGTMLLLDLGTGSFFWPIQYVCFAIIFVALWFTAEAAMRFVWRRIKGKPRRLIDPSDELGQMKRPFLVGFWLGFAPTYVVM
ncbi:hypothetical protein AB3Y40_03440 [Yoonia sp. R2331]|uniref:hypothetical protein n=1 Tax=Yoonia sp. R2331 TaxID=3237238 RepID=UPI0034E4F7BE